MLSSFGMWNLKFNSSKVKFVHTFVTKCVPTIQNMICTHYPVYDLYPLSMNLYPLSKCVPIYTHYPEYDLYPLSII